MPPCAPSVLLVLALLAAVRAVPVRAAPPAWTPPSSRALLAALAAVLLTGLAMAFVLGLTPSPSAVWARFAPPSEPHRPARSDARGGCHPGIYNAGNTCFLNATLQALGSVPVFLSHVDTARRQAEEDQLSAPVSEAGGSLWAELNAPRGRPWAVHATSVARALAAPRPGAWHARTLTGAHEQQDAHELLLLLLDALHDEAERTRRYRLEYARLSGAGLRSLLPSPSPQGRRQLSALQSLVGRMTRCLVCGYSAGVRVHTSPVLELTPNGPDLLSCLLHWADEERVEWTCWRCSVRRTQARLASRLEQLKTTTASLPATSGKRSDLDKLSSSTKKRRKKKSKKEPTKVAGDSVDRQEEAGRAERVLSQVARILRDNLSEDEVEEHGVPPLPPVDDGLTTPPPEEVGNYEELWTELRARGDRFPNVAATRQVLLRGGDVLPIHLSRSSFFGGGAVKNSAFISFPETLQLPPQGWFEPQLSDEEALALSLNKEQAALLGVEQQRLEQLKADFHGYEVGETYRLMAVVVHLGAHGYGHYIAFRRRPCPVPEDEFEDARTDPSTEDWLRISDADVRPCSLAEVLGQRAYLLFYQKVSTDSKGGRIGPVAIPSTMGAYRRRLKPRTILRAEV